MRTPTSEERQLVGVATTIGGCEVGLFEVTATQLEKGIVDANASIRQAFLATGFHDFSAQSQGEKVLLEAGFLTSTGLVETKVSLYRPNTKDGDPRLWVYDLKRLSPETIPGDLVAIVQDGSSCAVFNATALTRSGGSLGPLATVFPARAQGPAGTAAELLARLQSIAGQGPVHSPKRGATAVGHAVEAALGIHPNSSQDPDFKGIEIKSGRSLQGQENKTLMAMVPDWGQSPVGSYAQLVDRYGYDEGGLKRLYCSVDALKPNTQGLQLNVNYDDGFLEESMVLEGGTELALVWELDAIRRRLEKKHSETFWIEAEEVTAPSGSDFILRSVVHTSHPKASSLSSCLSTGVVFVDHAARETEGGGHRNHGMLFRVQARDLSSLFNVEGRYSLA